MARLVYLVGLMAKTLTIYSEFSQAGGFKD